MNEKENMKTVSQLSMLREDGEGAEQEFCRLLRFLALSDAEEENRTSIGEASPLREDLPEQSIPSKVLLTMTPAHCDGYVLVPKALEGDEK